jgi:hypothetical protein
MPTDVNDPRPDFMHDLASAGDRMVLHAAHNHYVQRNWSAALTLFRTIHDRNARLSAEFGLPLTIGHCAIELGAEDEMRAPAEHAATDPQRAELLLHDMRSRVYELCRAGDFARAVGLLRLIAPFCPLVGGAYQDGFLAGESPECARLRTAGEESDPGFLAELGISPSEIGLLKQRYAGARLLVAVRRFYLNNPRRRHEPVDYVGRTAERFGMTVREWNSHWRPADCSHDDYVAGLSRAIEDFKPHLIFYDDLFETGVSVQSETVADQIRTVLEAARRRFGTRVIKCFPDAWAIRDERVFHGLGSCVDLVYHCHPAILGKASPHERSASFCYPWPHQVATPTKPAGVIPRASFVGTIYSFNFGRVVWWAEAGNLGLPIDFVTWLPGGHPDADPESGGQFSDTDFVNALHSYRLSINFTRRSSGVKILTGKTVEIPMAGGCLLEEHSVDAAYFLKPGIHYLPFATLADLAAAIETLLDDEPRRLRMVDASQRWVNQYFSGDYFWAGLLARLFA